MGFRQAYLSQHLMCLADNLMAKAQIKIVGALIACSEGLRDDWRNVSCWVAGVLKETYGDQISLKYFDLFEEGKPDLPKDAVLPIIILNDKVISMGGKISIPLIKKRTERNGHRINKSIFPSDIISILYFEDGEPWKN